ncbi:tRNA-guanine transglycosylase, partial [Candidatus Saccharibacteria bacterium]|nr:tRNA-guanine transglycosylase [Candidatus Saccharibacteria bacterium]
MANKLVSDPSASSSGFSFELKKQIGLARVGEIYTPHGVIRTPAFVAAATLANVKGLTWKQIDELGAEAALANTYHLILQPGTELIEKAGGLNQFMGYDRPTFTDSGGFQIFSIPGVKIDDDGATFKSHLDGSTLRMTPESSMQAQWQIGADIHMAFDQLASSGSHEDMKIAMERTHNWAERCLAEQSRLKDSAKSPYQALYGVVQGGKFMDLRSKSARTL